MRSGYSGVGPRGDLRFGSAMLRTRLSNQNGIFTSILKHLFPQIRNGVFGNRVASKDTVGIVWSDANGPAGSPTRRAWSPCAQSERERSIRAPRRTLFYQSTDDFDNTDHAPLRSATLPPAELGMTPLREVLGALREVLGKFWRPPDWGVSAGQPTFPRSFREVREV